MTDRHVENWILCDENLIKSEFDAANYKYPGDGCKGKIVLKGVAGGADLGFRDKAKLLKKSSPKHGAIQSGSLGAFIGQIDFDWAWANS